VFYLKLIINNNRIKLKIQEGCCGFYFAIDFEKYGGEILFEYRNRNIGDSRHLKKI